MPVRYESPAPVGLEGNLYEQNYALQLQRQNQQAAQQAFAQQQQLAAAASHRGSGGGGSDIQDAINHRDAMQFAQQRAAFDEGGVSQSQVFQAQAQAAQQRGHFELEAELSNTQLSQQETMRLARMKNAIGDVANDPTLSAQEKADMTLQLKTGIDPLARRETHAKLQAQNQLNEAKAKEMDFQGGVEKRRLDVLGKTLQDRGGFYADPSALANITADLDANTPELPEIMGGAAARKELIAQQAQAEAMRQGLGHSGVMQPDGKVEFLTGPGSKADQVAAAASRGTGGKGAGVTDHPSGLDLAQWLKVQAHAEAAIDKRANETTTNDIGIKTSSHPDLQDLGKRAEAVKSYMKDVMKAPVDLGEYNAMSKPKTEKVTGYDPSKAPWNKNKAPKVAAAATPAGQGAAENTPAPAVISAINKKANDQANSVLNRSDIPEAIRPQVAEKIGVMRRLLVEVGGDIGRMTKEKKAEFDQAKAFIDKNAPDPKPLDIPRDASAQPPADPANPNPTVGGTPIEGGGVAPTPAQFIGDKMRWLGGAIRRNNLGYGAKRAGER